MGCTNRNRPPPSASLRGFSEGLAFLQAVSVKGMLVLKMASGYFGLNIPTKFPAVTGYVSNLVVAG